MIRNIIATSNGIIGTNFKEEFINNYIKGKTVIVIDNGTYGTRNYENRQENVSKFMEYGAKTVDLVTIDSSNQDCILKYDVCYMMGGNIANLVELVQKTKIKSILKEFFCTGLYIGESAGSVILDKEVEWYFKLKRGTKPKYDVVFETYGGLGLIDKHIYPHYDKESQEGLKKIKEYPEEMITLEDSKYIEMSDLEVTLEMACSINGFIADEKGQEDFLSNRGWQIMLDFLKEYDVLIWGRKTFENVMTWGEEWIKDLKNTNMIILSSKKVNTEKLDKAMCCNSIEKCLELCRKKNFKKLFVSGGAKTNNEFFQKDIVDKVILNYNPYILNKGIQLFEGNYFEKQLEFEKVILEQDGIVQVHYKINLKD